MQNKKFNFLIIIGIFLVLLSSCSTVQKAFDPERKNSTQEFLVEKKNPLAMPPDFDALPTPKNIIKSSQSENKDVKLLILENSEDKIAKDGTENLNKDLEKFILEKIKNN
jgi:hypothetical protein